MTVSPRQKVCTKYKFATTSSPLPAFGRHYWEVRWTHARGCYDSIGLVAGQYTQGRRLGQEATSWAVRLYGNHSGHEHYGAVHDDRHQDFFKQWQAGDRVGLLLDVPAKTLSVYRNGQKLGTPFANVQGAQLYPCVELCHAGAVVANFNATPPPG